MKTSINQAKAQTDNSKRLEMFRKAREDAKKENQEENEAAYQKRVSQLDQKDSGKVETVQDDWLKGMKAHNTNDDWAYRMQDSMIKIEGGAVLDLIFSPINISYLPNILLA